MTRNADAQPSNPSRGKFLVAGLLILFAVVYLIVSSTLAAGQFFLTVDELLARSDSLIDRPIRVTGAVIEDTIDYDAQNLILKFTVVQLPADDELLQEQGGLAAALRTAVQDPTRQRLEVIYYGVKPDLLRRESQAIMSGKLGNDGIFIVDELLLKCPTKYEEAVPNQIDA